MVYADVDFQAIAESVDAPVSEVKRFASAFEEAATWIRLGERRPNRRPPTRVRHRMGQISNTATRLLRHLGVDDPEQAADGPGDEEIRDWLASAGDGDEESIVSATEQIGILVEVIRAREAALLLRARAMEAAQDPVRELIVPRGNTGDDIVNQWIAAMLVIYTAVTGRRVATSVGALNRPNEGVAEGPLIRFLLAAGGPVGLDQSEDALRRRVRLVQESLSDQD
jgi:hypothetical protein